MVLIVTGPSGAGRTTAIRALEDIKFDVIDNLPLSLLPRVLKGQPPDRPLALGIDVRTRDFSVDALVAIFAGFDGLGETSPQMLYLDASEDVLLRRYSETRRRHPLAEEGEPLPAIVRERAMLAPVRALADVLIDTSALSPHDLRADIAAQFCQAGNVGMTVSVKSFSYKRGLPRGLDIAFDCRFLRNPHWDSNLRALDGRDLRVATYVKEDQRFLMFHDQVKSLLDLVLPGHQDEGKSVLSIGFGCTGGKHRSVMMTEMIGQALGQDGWPVSITHRELERREAA